MERAAFAQTNFFYYMQNKRRASVFATRSQAGVNWNSAIHGITPEDDIMTLKIQSILVCLLCQATVYS